MNSYMHAAFNQIEVLIQSVTELLEKLEPTDLAIQPTENKFSVRQLLAHMSLICKADLLISDETSEEEMKTFYSSISISTTEEMKEALLSNFSILKKRYLNYSEEELLQTTTSYWGVSYTRFEWLLEISSHLYHHRGQLHAMLVHCSGKDPQVSLFE
ncbi:DinB family protein [Sporosarcina oncorhynchi]|uniref:DinB family protein n=1 Tax=Sporosarcina oncorhynchi TaxID=3056444 RepID=A0ABZ0L4T8_9BACL|nr:DinB family protein [Sporosarcina sp. T2O-4]WOV87194.1 DinB family protein [Sporosarcina sp. T2O-4]